jgi:hypothetical protein
MQEILYDYQMNVTTWVYLSSLIMIAVYFKFRRFWSVRNLDLVGLILFAPGLLLILHAREMKGPSATPSADAQASSRQADRNREIEPGREKAELGNKPVASVHDLSERSGDGKETADNGVLSSHQLEQRGYLWLLVIGAFFLFRMLIDSAMVRRPLLEPNLSAGGLTFACAAMLVFLMSNVITHQPGRTDRTLHVAPAGAPQGRDENSDIFEILQQRGPGYPLFHVFSAESENPAKRATAIIAHLAVVLGMVLIGYRHFDNTHTGIAAATLYLLLPYTANFTPRIDHVVPAALLVWAIQCYRRPVIAGILVGLAAGLIWYPLFLLPLWCSFYWRRGLLRFVLSLLVVLGIIAASLAFMPSSLGTFGYQFCHTFGVMHVHSHDIRGFWEGSLAPFRWPVMAAFVAMCVCLALWPAQKNLGSLLACSAAVMLGTQFWKAYAGGTFMAWYLPLLILTIFRPNLEDRVALSAISEGWRKWRK